MIFDQDKASTERVPCYKRGELHDEYQTMGYAGKRESGIQLRPIFHAGAFAVREPLFGDQREIRYGMLRSGPVGIILDALQGICRAPPAAAALLRDPSAVDRHRQPGHE